MTHFLIRLVAIAVLGCFSCLNALGAAGDGGWYAYYLAFTADQPSGQAVTDDPVFPTPYDACMWIGEQEPGWGITGANSLTFPIVECDGGPANSAFAEFRCNDPEYYAIQPGRCVTYDEAVESCSTCSSGAPNPTVGNPIEVRTGRKLDYARDYSTSDDLLFVDRYYNTVIGDDTLLPSRVLRFGGIGWSFDFGPTLVLSGDFANDPILYVYLPSGLTYGFSLDAATGDFLPSGPGTYNAEALSRFTVAYDGTLPTNLEDLNTQASSWVVTDNDTRITYSISTLEIPGQTYWSYGYATTIAFQGGYSWDLTYGSDAELTEISDSFGRSLEFSWIEGNGGTGVDHKILIDQILLPDGTALQYSYLPSVETSEMQTPTQWDHISSVERLISPSGSGPSNVATSTTYHYDDPNTAWLVTGETDGRGVLSATWEYDEQGRAIASTLGGEDQYSIAYSTDEFGAWIRTVTNPLDKEFTYTYSGTNQLDSIDAAVSAHSPATELRYLFSDGLVATLIDEEARETTYERDCNGLPTKIVEAAGLPEERVTSIIWRSDHQPAGIEVPGLTTYYSYNGAGLVSSITEIDTTSQTVPYSTNGQTRTWAFSYTAEGLVASVDGPLSGTSDTVHYTYDSQGYLETTTDELGHVTEILSVDGNGRPLSSEDPNSIVTEYAYDTLGNVVEITVDPSGADVTTSFTYDKVSNLTSMTREDGSSFAYAYDDANRLVSITDAKGNVQGFTHDAMGNVVQDQVTDSSLTVLYSQSATFDELGRLLESIGGDSATWTYGYDKVNNLTSITDPRTGVQGQAFNGLNQLIQTVDQSSFETNITPTPLGDTAVYEDPRDIETAYVRNGWGEVIQESSPDIGTVVYERNQLGLITEKTDARSIVTGYSYDVAGRLTSVEYPASSGENITYTYDSTASGNLGVGRLTGFTDPVGTTSIVYNSLGLVASQTALVSALSTSATTTYVYDDAGNLSSIEYPSGRRISFSRDIEGAIGSVASRRTPSDPFVDIATGIEWQPFGEEARSMLFENGLNLLRTFDLDYRAEQLALNDSSTALFDRDYDYLDDLNLTNIWDSITPANSESYAYSTTNQLQNANGPWGEDIFNQDGARNQIAHIHDDGTTTTEDELTYPGTSNQLASISRDSTTFRTFTYDAAGNIATDVQGGVTTAYTYNDADRLASFTRGGTQRGAYTYNARGQLVVRTVTNSTNNGTTVYFYDLEGRPIAEYDGSTGDLKREYVWLGDRPLAVIDPDGSGGDDVYYVHADHLNRPIALTDASKAVVAEFTWLPFGDTFAYSGTVGLDLRFPGQMFQEESGLFYNWFRQYDPTTGRYTQPDPLGLVGGANRYTYVDNNPLQLVDPTGLWPYSIPVGTPNTSISIYNRSGQLATIRMFGAGGSAICDIDYHKPHGDQTYPHIHVWTLSGRVYIGNTLGM